MIRATAITVLILAVFLTACDKFEHSEESPDVECVNCSIADSVAGTYIGTYRELIFTGNLGGTPQFDTIIDTSFSVTISRYYEQEPVSDSLYPKFTFSHFISGKAYMQQVVRDYTEFPFLGGGYYDWRVSVTPYSQGFNYQYIYSTGKMRFLLFEKYEDPGGNDHFYPRKEFLGYK